MTCRRYREGASTRLLVAKDTFLPKRLKLPVLVISLDGALGYFDEYKNYHLREKSISYLQSLSHSFRLVAISMEPKSVIRRLCTNLSEMQRSIYFDAVYKIARRSNSYRLNITHCLLDFQDENEESLDVFTQANIVLVLADR
jgi:hypothetical protein